MGARTSELGGSRRAGHGAIIASVRAPPGSVSTRRTEVPTRYCTAPHNGRFDVRGRCAATQRVTNGPWPNGTRRLIVRGDAQLRSRPRVPRPAGRGSLRDRCAGRRRLRPGVATTGARRGARRGGGRRDDDDGAGRLELLRLAPRPDRQRSRARSGDRPPDRAARGGHPGGATAGAGIQYGRRSLPPDGGPGHPRPADRRREPRDPPGHARQARSTARRVTTSR